MKVRKYNDLGYTTFFNPRTGFFARVEDKGKPEPFWSPYGPELMDISITNWCDKECTFCYRNSSKTGKHMSLEDYKKLIDSAKDMGVFQVALGGGNPNQHPDFIEILRYTFEQGIIPNYTTNGRGLSKDILVASKKYCGAVAISAYYPFKEMEKAIDILIEKGIKTNVHYILDAESINTAIEWLKGIPKFLQKINALIFLNYKPSGRLIFEDKMLRNSHRLQEFFNLATSKECMIKIGFDSCCVSGILSRTKTSTTVVDACDAGRFSLFVSEEMMVYPCSFQAGLTEGVFLGNQQTLHDIWINSDNMKTFRNYFKSEKCLDCPSQKVCMNGCPLFDEIVICGRR